MGLDVNYLPDADGTTFMFLNMVCMGIGFQIEVLLREGHGTPTSSECLDAIMQYWVAWAGYPKEAVSDRGMNNRGVLAKELSAAGVYPASIGLKLPTNLGRWGDTAISGRRSLVRSCKANKLQAWTRCGGSAVK